MVAAGNDGADPGYANNPYMITVSATDSSDAKASWSNYGAFIDVAAPGVSIQTTSRGGSYGNWSGTSFASPVTAGVVAVIMGANPAAVSRPGRADPEELGRQDRRRHPSLLRQRPSQRRRAVAMAASSATVTVDSEAPSVNIFSPGSGSTVSGLVQVEVNASDNVGVTDVSLYANGR